MLLFISVFSYYNSRTALQTNSQANVQLLSSQGNRGLYYDETIDSTASSTAEIESQIIIKNFGLATAQIINASIFPLKLTSNYEDRYWFYISDKKFSNPKDILYRYRFNPVLGIKDPHIPPLATKTLHVGFYNTMDGIDTLGVPNCTINLIFSNGAQLAIRPEILSSGATVKY